MDVSHSLGMATDRICVGTTSNHELVNGGVRVSDRTRSSSHIATSLSPASSSLNRSGQPLLLFSHRVREVGLRLPEL